MYRSFASVANATPPGRHDTAFGYYTFAASLGQALGPGLILLFGGSRTIPATGSIFVSALGIAAALLAVTLLLQSSVRARTSDVAAQGGGMRILLRRPGLFRALTISCVILAAVDITLVYLPARPPPPPRRQRGAVLRLPGRGGRPDARVGARDRRRRAGPRPRRRPAAHHVVAGRIDTARPTWARDVAASDHSTPPDPTAEEGSDP
jgi:hypothetical protein